MYFDTLRQEHFPAERNFLSAHLTLFHHLPAEHLDMISGQLDQLSATTKMLELRFIGWRSLGRGVAMNVESSQLAAVHREIARRWADELTPQDRQAFRPHITVQNKVEPAVARELLASLSAETWPAIGNAVGLDLWEYLGGPWKLISTHHFSE